MLNTTYYKNFWDITKAVLREKYIGLNVHIKKKPKGQRIMNCVSNARNLRTTK